MSKEKKVPDYQCECEAPGYECKCSICETECQCSSCCNRGDSLVGREGQCAFTPCEDCWHIVGGHQHPVINCPNWNASETSGVE